MPDAFGNVTGLEFAMASQAQSNAFLGNLNNQIGAGVWNPATSPNTDPNTGMTYPGSGMVGGYPSFGEAIYPGYGPRPGVPTQQPDYSSYVPEQAFSPSGGRGYYGTPLDDSWMGPSTPSSSYVPEQAFSPSGGAGGYTPAPAYNPFDQYANGGYNPFSQQTYQPAAQQNVGSSFPTAGGGGRGYYGTSLDDSWMGPSFDDRYSASPGIPTGLASDPYSFPPAITTGAQPSPNLPKVPDNFNTRFAPVAGESMYSPQDFPGWTPPVPNGGRGYSGTQWDDSWMGPNGGIGSDATRDQFAWQLAQSSPYATPGPPSRPTADLGYSAQPAIQDMQRLLQQIDQGTGNQNLDPNWFGPGASGDGGRSYYQGRQPTADEMRSANF